MKPKKDMVGLKIFIASARSLDNVSASELAHRYGVDMKTAEYELTIARQKCAAQAMDSMASPS